jgi:hypothetical protein
MKHMIYTFPAADKQLQTFKCNEETKSEIHEFFENGLNELSILRIESEAGNGKNHLLQAIAIELREKRTRVVCLHFNEGDSFSDLSVYHHNDILNATFLCIQNLDIPLKHHSSAEFIDFMKVFASRKGKMIYSFKCLRDDNISNRIESCFDGKVKVLSLPPISCELRKKWAKEILGKEESANLPEDVFTASKTNKDFLDALLPFKQQIQLLKGNDYAFNQRFEEQIINIRLELRKLNLSIAELQHEKAAFIRKQEYEKAADLREKEREYLRKIRNLHQRVKNLKEELPFVPGQLNLIFSLTVLLNEFETERNAINQLNRAINLRIDALEEDIKNKKELGTQGKKTSLMVELRDWQSTIDRFNKSNMR